VSADAAIGYRRLVALISRHAGDGPLIAGPTVPKWTFSPVASIPQARCSIFLGQGDRRGGLGDMEAWAARTSSW
jgi:hypothetical protein